MMHDGRSKFPWSLLISALVVTALGLAGLIRADELYGRTELVERQLIWLMLAMPAFFAFAFIPFRMIRTWSMPAFAVSLILLAIVLFMPPINGSRRWIPLGLLDLQASEPARLAFILALASWLMHRSTQRSVRGLVVPVLFAAVPMALILREPDMDTALLFLPVLVAVLLAAGAKARHLLISACSMALLLPVLWTQMSAEQQSRIVTVFTQRDGGLPPTGDGFHLHQSKQVLALGGFHGSISQEESPLDDEAAWQLPAARTDFIFVMIGERLGFAGCASLILSYFVLIGNCLTITQRTQEPWGRLTAIGITTLLMVQIVLNTGMTVGIVPITGTILPLCSYGGSSLLTTYAALGLMANLRMSAAPEVIGEPFLHSRMHRRTQPY